MLKDVLAKRGVFSDPKMKLLLFTEHKDTLDFLAGDGKEGRPLGKLVKWGLSVTQIHGGMKIGDRDSPGTRFMPNANSVRIAKSLLPQKPRGKVSIFNSAG